MKRKCLGNNKVKTKTEHKIKKRKLTLRMTKHINLTWFWKVNFNSGLLIGSVWITMTWTSFGGIHHVSSHMPLIGSHVQLGWSMI